MTGGDLVTNGPRLWRTAAIVSGTCTVLLAAAMVVVGPGRLAAAASDEQGSAKDLVEELPVCYSRGTDAFGRAVNAPMSQDLNSTAALVDPDFKVGLDYYRRCLAPSFSFTVSNRGVAGRVVPDPATRTPQTDGPLQWANAVNNAMRGQGYVFTQHHMGSISSTVRGNEGTVQSYLIATHVFGSASTQTGAWVVYGTYTDKVAKIGGRWMITQRTLDTIYSTAIPPGQ